MTPEEIRNRIEIAGARLAELQAELERKYALLRAGRDVNGDGTFDEQDAATVDRVRTRRDDAQARLDRLWQQLGMAEQARRDEALVRAFSREELEAMDLDALQSLASDLNFAQGTATDPGERDGIAQNLAMAWEVIGARTSSAASAAPMSPQSSGNRPPPPSRDRAPAEIDEEQLTRDLNRLLELVQEFWVDDADEAEIMRIIDRWAATPEGLEAFFRRANNRHSWQGIMGEQYVPLIDSLLEELEGGNGRRFVALMQQSRNPAIREHEPVDQITFAESFWEDLSEGQIRDQIFGYFRGMGDAGIGMAEGIYHMVTDPAGALRALANLPEAVQMFWANRQQLWNSFMAAPPEEQARMIGRITGEFELFIATLPAAGGAGTAVENAAARIGTLEATLPRLEQATALASGSTRAAGGAISMSVDVAALGGPAGQLATGAVLMSEASNLGGSAAEGAETLQESLPEGFADDAISAIENDELRASGAHLNDLTSHAQSRSARAQAGLTAAEGNSAHISARSAMRLVEGYNPRAALTRLLDSVTHRAFDDYWKRIFRQMAGTGETTIEVREYFRVMSDAMRSNPHFTPDEAASMIELLRDELFVQHGLRDGDLLRLPYSR